MILLDIAMPGMDGFEVCRRLKATDCMKDVPVVFLTALTETADKVRAFDSGGWHAATNVSAPSSRFGG